jgi:hypothetical protein
MPMKARLATIWRCTRSMLRIIAARALTTSGQRLTAWQAVCSASAR